MRANTSVFEQESDTEQLYTAAKANKQVNQVLESLKALSMPKAEDKDYERDQELSLGTQLDIDQQHDQIQRHKLNDYFL